MFKNYFNLFNMSRRTETQEKYLKNFLNLYQKWATKRTSQLQIKSKELEDLEKAPEDLRDEAKIGALKEQISQFEDEINLSMDRIATIKSGLVLDEEEFVDDGKTKEERIFDAYIELIYKSEVASLTKKQQNNFFEEDKVKREQVFHELEVKRNELSEMYATLSNPEARKKYLKELERIETLDTAKREHEEMLEQSRKYVQEKLGADFDPDNSDIGARREFVYDMLKPGKEKPIKWRVELYPAPETLFVGNSKYPGLPQFDREIFAYRYGAFSFSSLFRKDGTPTYKDDTSEIIGITRVNTKGEENIDFVITPLITTYQVKNVTPEELIELIKQNRKPIPFQTAEEARKRNSSTTQKDERRIEALKKGVNGLRIRGNQDPNFDDFQRGSKIIDLQKVKSGKNQIGINSKIDDSQEIIHVLLPAMTKRQFSQKEGQIFADIAASEWLIDVATRCNGGYLGSLVGKDENMKVSFAEPMEGQRIEACCFAKNNSGRILGVRLSGLPEDIILEANNIDALFGFLIPIQRKLVEQERNKKLIGTKKDVVDSGDAPEY